MTQTAKPQTVRQCCPVIIMGVGGAGRVAARAAFRASRAFFSEECPHVGLVEFDLTQRTGRQDTNLIVPKEPGRMITYVVPPASGAAIAARIGKDKSHRLFTIVDPNVVSGLPQTDHLGGCAVPAGARLAIEFHSDAIREVALQVAQLADRLRAPQPGWRCMGSLWVVVYASSAGAVGSNDIHVVKMLCGGITGTYRVLSAGLLIAEAGRVPSRAESLALEGTHTRLVRAAAQRPPRSNEPPYANCIDFWMFIRQTQSDERAFFGLAGTTAALISGAVLEGELQTLETRVNRVTDGRRCFACETRVVHHRPEMLADFASACAIERGAAAITARTALRPSALTKQYEHEWQSMGSTGDMAMRAFAERSTTVERVVSQLRLRVSARLGTGLEAERAIVSAIPAEVQACPVDDGLRTVERPVRGLADTHYARARDALADGRPDEGFVIVETMRAYATARQAEVDEAQRDAGDAAEAALSEANAAIARAGRAGDAGSKGLTRLVEAFINWFAGPAEDMPAEDRPFNSVLEAYVAATLRLRAVGRLRGVFTHVQRRADELEALIQAELSVIHGVASLASDYRLRVVKDAGELGADLAALVTAGDENIRDAALRTVIPGSADPMLQATILDAIRSVRSEVGKAEIATIFREAVRQADRVTAPLRSMDLAGLIQILDDTGLEAIGTALQPESTLEFRKDQVGPSHSVRYALPGGASGRLGRWLAANRRAMSPVISDVPASEHVACGVLVSTPFAIDDLQAYHTIYREAIDQMRREGREPFLVSDRRLIGEDDGIASDEAMDDCFVRALVCDAIACSRGRTFYRIPAGEPRRPVDVRTSELDAVFGRVDNGGGRLGNSVPEFRSALRTVIRLRDGLAAEWSKYVSGTSPDERRERVAAIEREGVPSPELLPALQRLRAKVEDDVIRSGRSLPAPRPTLVPTAKPSRSEREPAVH